MGDIMDEKESYELDCFIGDLDALEKELKNRKEVDFFESKSETKKEKNVNVSEILKQIRGEEDV